MSGPKKMIIYNIFPLLAGKFTGWEEHFKRASEMGFNWIYVNPIHYPGYSGSLYSVSDYFRFNPPLLDECSTMTPEDQVREMTQTARQYGLKIMIDLVINHCAFDSPLTKEHPEWFQWKGDKVVSPYAMDGSHKVLWRDLAKFNVRRTSDSENLFRFFMKIVDFLMGLGFKGFRCDAAYQLPKKLWKRLIGEVRSKYPKVIFAAETLGCTADETRSTAKAGFDYIFNSSKWWDYNSHWMMSQYNLTREISPSISFPESHDTNRLMDELNGNINGMKQRYLFSALFSAGVMMPMGYEFGFRKKPHVVHTRPHDWEETETDLTWFIRKINKVKAQSSVFQEESPTEILHYDNPHLLLMWKGSTSTKDEALIILNKDLWNIQTFYTDNLRKFVLSGAPLTDISPEYRVECIPEPFHYNLNPGQGLIYITKRTMH